MAATDERAAAPDSIQQASELQPSVTGDAAASHSAAADKLMAALQHKLATTSGAHAIGQIALRRVQKHSFCLQHPCMLPPAHAIARQSAIS